MSTDLLVDRKLRHWPGGSGLFSCSSFLQCRCPRTWARTWWISDHLHRRPHMSVFSWMSGLSIFFHDALSASCPMPHRPRPHRGSNKQGESRTWLRTHGGVCHIKEGLPEQTCTTISWVNKHSQDKIYSKINMVWNLKNHDLDRVLVTTLWKQTCNAWRI